MKPHYDVETGTLYIQPKPEPGAEIRKVADGSVVDLDAKGEVVGFNTGKVSAWLDLTKIEIVNLPLPVSPLQTLNCQNKN